MDDGMDITDKLRFTAGHLVNGIIADGEVETHMLVDAADEIDRLRAALGQCAAPYSTPPGTGRRCAEWVNAEFQRRMDLAHAALNP